MFPWTNPGQLHFPLYEKQLKMKYNILPFKIINIKPYIIFTKYYNITTPANLLESLLSYIIPYLHWRNLACNEPWILPWRETYSGWWNVANTSDQHANNKSTYYGEWFQWNLWHKLAAVCHETEQSFDSAGWIVTPSHLQTILIERGLKGSPTI